MLSSVIGRAVFRRLGVQVIPRRTKAAYRWLFTWRPQVQILSPQQNSDAKHRLSRGFRQQVNLKWYPRSVVSWCGWAGSRPRT